MDSMKIEDSQFLLKSTCEDLRALRSLLQLVNDQLGELDEYVLVKVVIRALEPIIGDIQRGVSIIDEELHTISKD